MENFLTLLGVLTMVILILCLAWLATRWIGTHSVPGMSGGARPGGGGTLRLLAQLAVGRSERLVLVQLEQSCFLLGVTEHGITLLRELGEEEAARWLAAGQEQVAYAGFAEVLREALRKK